MERYSIDSFILDERELAEHYKESGNEDGYKGKSKLIEFLEELKSYKKAEENGLLIHLPCRVGDTVYTVCSWGIESGVVGSIEIISDRIFVNNKHGAMIGESNNIYTTREEAEQALKQMGE